MLHLIIGTDREKARKELDADIKKVSKRARVLRVSDASTLADLSMALQGRGMFDSERAVVFDSTLANEEMRTLLLNSLAAVKASPDHYFIFEEKVDAATRKQLEKFAEDSKKIDAAKKEKDNSIFQFSSLLRSGDKKKLWLAYQRELRKSEPEAIHGVLFWAAKQMFLGARADIEKVRATKLIATLAQLPHEARRRGEELEYALERFVLSGA